jgi:GNAT superfamily N-acetyltransferase
MSHAPLTIRPALPEEQSVLENIQRRASLAWEEDRAALLAHPDAIEVPVGQIEAGCVYVAESGSDVVGFGVIVPRPDGDMEVDGVFVEPTDWKKGIGRTLIQEAERRAAIHGANSLRVVANPRTESFYAACGFARIGEIETRFGIGLIMCKAVGCAA